MSIVSKLTAGTAIALALSIVPAFADGMEKKSYASHSHECANSGRFGGAYVGASVGSGSLTSTLTDRGGASFGADSSQTQNGLLLGGQAGYNMQKCNTVFGIEADFSWADLSSFRSFDPANAGAGGSVLSRSTNWLGSVRTKTGVVVGDLFLFATGGLAIADFKATGFDAGAATANSTVRFSDTKLGWVAGVGTEYAVSDKISVTGDALYYDFGTNNATSTGNNTFADRQTLWVTRLGVNIKLGADTMK